jgi:hypothetical protein
VVLAVGTGLGLLPAAGVRKLVDYWYTGRIQLGEAADDGLRDVMDVMVAADYLQAWHGVAAMCAAHVHRLDMATRHWVSLWRLGSANAEFAAIKAQAKLLTAQNFKEAAAQRCWVRAPLGAVRELLTSRWLSANSEDEVLAAVLAWADRAAGGGADALAELLPLVRLPQVSRGALAHLRQHALAAGNPTCHGLLAEAAAWTPAATGGRVWGPRSAHRSLVIISTGRVQRYDAATSHWDELPPPTGTARGQPAAASLGGRVYLAGGFEFVVGLCSARVTCLDPGSAGGEWATVAPMSTARYGAAAASLGGLLYVTGGTGRPGAWLRTVERYTPASNTWEALADMTSARHCPQLMALGGFLYAIGGWSGAARLATAERYDPASNTWTPIASMTSARSGFAGAAMGGFLYVTGGHNDDGVLRSCERYDLASNTWSRIADLPEPRCDHALACLGDELYAIGGGIDAGYGSLLPPRRYSAATSATAAAWVEMPRASGSDAFMGFGYLSHWTSV